MLSQTSFHFYAKPVALQADTLAENKKQEEFGGTTTTKDEPKDRTTAATNEELEHKQKHEEDDDDDDVLIVEEKSTAPPADGRLCSKRQSHEEGSSSSSAEDNEEVFSSPKRQKKMKDSTMTMRSAPPPPHIEPPRIPAQPMILGKRPPPLADSVMPVQFRPPFHLGSVVDPTDPVVQEELKKANYMSWDQYQTLYTKYAPTAAEYADKVHVVNAMNILDGNGKVFAKSRFDYETVAVEGLCTSKKQQKTDGKTIIDVDVQKFTDLIIQVLAEDRKEKEFSILIVSDVKKAKAPHPKTLLALDEGKLKLDNGALLVTPELPTGGCPLYILQKRNHSVHLCVNGGPLSNMQPYDVHIERTFGSIGVVSKAHPQLLQSARIVSKEQIVQFPKVFATLFPSLCAATPPSAAGGSELFERLSTPGLECKKAKACGRQAQLKPVYFENQKGAELAIKAGVAAVCLQLAQDPDAATLFEFAASIGLSILEAAMHQGNGPFAGWAHDLAWGSVDGGIQCCTQPMDMMLVTGEGRRLGNFERVTQLVTRAFKVDEEDRDADDITEGVNLHEDELKFLGLESAVSFRDPKALEAAAAVVLNGIVRDIERMAKEEEEAVQP
jgi:hypothetical protein